MKNYLIMPVTFFMNGNSFYITAIDTLLGRSGNNIGNLEYEGEELTYQFLTDDIKILTKNYFDLGTKESVEYLKFCKVNFKEIAL